MKNINSILISLFFLSSYLVAQNICALEIKGEWQQGAVLLGQVPHDTQVEFNKRKLKLTADGKFVIGLGRDAPVTVVLTTIIHGKVRQHSFTVKQRQYDVQRVDGVPQQTVEPSQEQVERINRENNLVAVARIADLRLDFFLQEFQWPLIGPVSGVYGSQRVYNGIPKTPHFGVDIAMPVGTQVKAPAGGVVTLAHPDMFLSGGTLIIDHGHGLSSTFLHLSKILVKVGDKISQGQEIALVGQTGRASGAHLHWAMNWFTERVDPQLVVGVMPASR